MRLYDILDKFCAEFGALGYDVMDIDIDIHNGSPVRLCQYPYEEFYFQKEKIHVTGRAKLYPRKDAKTIKWFDNKICDVVVSSIEHDRDGIITICFTELK